MKTPYERTVNLIARLKIANTNYWSMLHGILCLRGDSEDEGSWACSDVIEKCWDTNLIAEFLDGENHVCRLIENEIVRISQEKVNDSRFKANSDEDTKKIPVPDQRRKI